MALIRRQEAVTWRWTRRAMLVGGGQIEVYSEDLVRAAFASALPRWNRIE